MDVIALFFACLTHQAFGAVPDSVSPTLALLPPYENETDYFIGELSKLQLVAAFPSGTTSDVNIELLPSTNVTVMGLGDVTVSKVGTNLNIPTPTMVKYETDETKSAAVKIFNRGVFTIGDITNSGSSSDYAESTIVIEFEAVVASISGINDAFVHWVSAGIEYNNSYNVWVGQVSHTIRTALPNTTNNSTYELNDVGGYTLGINTVKVLTFVARIPYPYPPIASEVIVLTNTTDSLHVLGLRLVDAGVNYKYMFDFTKTVDYITTCTRSNRRRVDLGSLYNKGALEEGGNADDNMLVFEAFLFLEPEAVVGDLFSFGLGVEVSGTEVWVTHLNMTAVEASGTQTSSHSLLLAPQGSTNVEIGQAIFLEVNLTTTENTSFAYTIDVVTSHVGAGDSGLMVAKIEFLSSGEQTPCLPTPNITYSLDSNGLVNKGTLQANITNYGLPMVTAANGSDIVLRVALVVSPIKAVLSETYRTTVSVTTDDGVTVSQSQDYLVSGTVTYDTSVNYTFHLYHKCQKNCITVGSIFEFFIDVATERDTNPGPVVFEFPVPANLNQTNFSVCKFEIIDIGNNAICVNSEAAIAGANLTTLDDGTHSRVRMGISPLCNVGLVDDASADNFTIRVLVKMNLNDTTTQDGLFEWFGFGGKYSSTQIWVAQYKIWVKGPTYFPEFALLEGIAVDSADVANITWPGNYEIQFSYDGEAYSAAQFTWPTPTSNGSHDIYTLPAPYMVSYLRMILNQCESGCYVEHEFITKSLEGYLEIFDDQAGNYKRQFAIALDNNQDSCFSLPVQGTTPPVYWARFNTTMLQVTPQSFNFSITGEGISCSASAGTKVLQVSYPTSSSVGQFHGDLQFCKNTRSDTNGGKTTCVYDCNCPDESQCSEIYIFMANAVEGDTSPWTLCEMSASNL